MLHIHRNLGLFKGIDPLLPILNVVLHYLLAVDPWTIGLRVPGL